MSSLGHLLETSRTRTRVRVVRDSWSTPRDIGHGPELPGTAGLPCAISDTGPSHPGSYRPPGHSDPGPRRPGELVEPAGPLTLA